MNRKYVFLKYLIVYILCFSLFPIFASKAENTNLSNLSVGDTVFFGRYYHTDLSSDEKIPIEWIVIGHEKNKITLLSKNILYYCKFGDYKEITSWDKSRAYSFLSRFYEVAFNEKEKAVVLPVKRRISFINGKKNRQISEKVYLLSASDIEYYFGYSLDENKVSSSSKEVETTRHFNRSEPTSYATHVYMDDEHSTIMASEDLEISDIWLSTSYQDEPLALAFTGSSFKKKDVTEKCGIRPVVNIDLKKAKDGVLLKELSTDINPVSLLFPLPESDIITLEIKMDFDRNLIFSKYDISVFLDDKHIKDLSHGERFQEKLSISRGEHILKLCKTDDYNVCGYFEFLVDEYSYLTGRIHANSNIVNIYNPKCRSRYDIKDDDCKEYLKQYDIVMDNLKHYYNLAYRLKRSFFHGTRVDYYYFLFNENTHSFIYFENPHFQLDIDEPVTNYKGTYEGDLESGIIYLTSEFGNVTELNLNKKGYVLADFETVCDTFIRQVYPLVNKHRLLTAYYLSNNDKLLYELVFPELYALLP